MSSDDQYYFEKGDAGAADCTPSTAGEIKKGGFIMLKGNPCKVIEYSTAKPGKHGSAKATIVGVDIFTNKKYEDSWPTSASVMVPNVVRTEHQVLDIDVDQFVILADSNGGRSDICLKLPVEDQEIYSELTNIWQNRQENSVLFVMIQACGKQKFTSARTK